MTNYPDQERRKTDRRSGRDRRKGNLDKVYKFLIWLGLKMEWRRENRRRDERRRGMPLNDL